MLARLVTLVADRLLGEDGREIGPELDRASLRPRRRRRGQKHLDPRVGRDDGADVTALGDPVAMCEQPPLLRHHRLTDLSGRQPRRCGMRDLRSADRLRHVLAVDQHPLAERDRTTVSAICTGSVPRRSDTSATHRYIAPLSR